MKTITNTISLDTTEFQPLVSYETVTPPSEWNAQDVKTGREATREVEEILAANGFHEYHQGHNPEFKVWITPTHVARIYGDGQGGNWSSLTRVQGVSVERDKHAPYYWADLHLWQKKSEMKTLADKTRTEPEFVGCALQALLNESRRQFDSGEYRPLSGCLGDVKMVAILGIPADQPERLHQLMLCTRPDVDDPEFEAKVRQIAEYVPCDAQALRELLMGTRPLRQWSTKCERE